MKLTCYGRNRSVYHHTIFDGNVDVNQGYPEARLASAKYNVKSDDVSLRFFRDDVLLQGSYNFELRLSVDDIFELVNGLYRDPQNKSIANNLIASLKLLRAMDDSDASGLN